MNIVSFDDIHQGFFFKYESGVDAFFYKSKTYTKICNKCVQNTIQRYKKKKKRMKRDKIMESIEYKVLHSLAG